MIDLDLNDKRLTTLNGQDIPETVMGYFSCSSNLLTSLEFGPKYVGRHFMCANNNLTSLKFGPEEVNDGLFNCNSNKLTSLEYCSTTIGYSLCANNNLFTNLKDIHKHFRDGFIGEHLSLLNNPLKSHLLGVILIPKLQRVFINDVQLQEILNKHLHSERDILECQEELIQNGFKEFARL